MDPGLIHFTHVVRAQNAPFESIREQTADNFEVLCRLLLPLPGSAQRQHPPASLHRVREQWATNEFAFASSAPQDSPRRYAHSLVEGVTPDFLQVSTFLDPNSLTHDDRYKCKSDAIRKRMTALRMARVPGGEISGIVEFSTTLPRLNGRN